MHFKSVCGRGKVKANSADSKYTRIRSTAMESISSNGLRRLRHAETQPAVSECISHSHSRFTAVRLPSVFPLEPNKALSQSFVCEGLGAPVRENHTPDLTGYFIVLFGCVKQAVNGADSLL